MFMSSQSVNLSSLFLCRLRPMRLTSTKCKWAATWQNQQNDCAPSKDSDQPGHLPSLIRFLAVRMKKAWVLSYPLSAQRRLWSDWRMPRLIWVFPGCTLILLVLSCRGSNPVASNWHLPYLNIQDDSRNDFMTNLNVAGLEDRTHNILNTRCAFDRTWWAGWSESLLGTQVIL